METPPRTWGRQEKPTRGDFERRNTPTHVGKTVAVRSSMVRGRKHPHARGEDRMGCCHFRLCQETPPRTWGRHRGDGAIRIRLRNTPTHVGKTVVSVHKLDMPEKHPHARGEDAHVARSSSVRTETPPRTWGRQAAETLEALDDRNTPTHVGKTLQFYPSRFPGLETPPRTWGRPVSLNVVLGCVRNTPTHVGKTAGTSSGRKQLEKHPHARGEDASSVSCRYGAEETPPRTWGRPGA